MRCRNLTTRVIWDGRLSNPIKMSQGNRQGGLPSPDDYITLLDDNLNIQEKSLLGFHIGNDSFVAPTCADDMLILAKSMFELQVLLSLVVTYANEEHYTIHPEKSVILPFNVQSNEQLEHLMEFKPWVINDKKLPVVKDLTHVGIQRNLNGIDPTIDCRISTGRKTLFSLLSAGLHGTNGLPARTALHLYQVYILPRVLYGLEALVIKKTQTDSIEQFQRSVLRSLLGLPNRTAIPALYILSGKIPIDRQIDQKQIMFLHSLISQGGRLRDLVQRQYVMKKATSKSWIPYIKKILWQYELPSIHDLLADTPSKLTWKHTVKQAILKETKKSVEEEAKSMSSLRFLNQTYCFDKCHSVVVSVTNPRQVERACIKSQMLTGTYTLQATRLKYKQVNSDICLLCGEESEDLTHALLRCQATAGVRQKYLSAIDAAIPYVFRHRATVVKNERLLTQLIMDISHTSITELLSLSAACQSDIERISRDLCYAVHMARSRIQ